MQVTRLLRLLVQVTRLLRLPVQVTHLLSPTPLKSATPVVTLALLAATFQVLIIEQCSIIFEKRHLEWMQHPVQCYKWTGWEGLDGIVYLWAEESIDSIEHLTPFRFVSLMCSNGSVGSVDDHG